MTHTVETCLEAITGAMLAPTMKDAMAFGLKVTTELPKTKEESDMIVQASCAIKHIGQVRWGKSFRDCLNKAEYMLSTAYVLWEIGIISDEQMLEAQRQALDRAFGET